MINYIKNEVGLLKKYINGSKMGELDVMDHKIKKSEFEISMLKD